LELLPKPVQASALDIQVQPMIYKSVIPAVHLGVNPVAWVWATGLFPVPAAFQKLTSDFPVALMVGTEKLRPPHMRLL
jgi:hypothetical protein